MRRPQKLRQAEPAEVKELRKIMARNNGLCSPKNVVRRARSKASALNPHFTWDNTKAGEKYRLWQARQLISRFRVYFRSHRNELRATRIIVSLRSDRHAGGGYRDLKSILRSRQRRQELLKTALSELKAWELKYEILKELIPIFEARRVVSQEVFDEYFIKPASVRVAAGRKGKK